MAARKVEEGEKLKRGLPASHPGELLAEMIGHMPQSKVEIAAALGMTRRMLYKLLDGDSAVTPAVALKLGKLLGNSAEFWLNLQQAHDLWRLRSEMAEELAAIPTFHGS